VNDSSNPAPELDDPEFTDETRFTILERVRVGIPLEIAAGMCSIDEEQLRAWCERGERDADGPYRQFVLDLEQSGAKGQSQLEGPLFDLAEKNPCVARTLASRLFPRRFSRRDPHARAREQHAQAKNDLLRARRAAEAARERAGSKSQDIVVVTDLSQIPAADATRLIDRCKVPAAEPVTEPQFAWRKMMPESRANDLIPEEYREAATQPDSNESTDDETSERRRVGRPTKYTPEIGKAIRSHVAKGLSPGTAAGLVRIPRATVYRWYARGKMVRDGVFSEFAKWISKASSVVQGALTSYLFNHVRNGDWRTRFWMCERFYPEEWARRDPKWRITDERLRLETAIMNDQRQRILQNLMPESEPLYIFMPDPAVVREAPAA